MFMGPLSVTKPWNTAGLGGMSRFLGRVWDTAQKPQTTAEPPLSLLKLLHKTIAKVTHDCDGLEFNTAISQMMIFINDAIKEDYCYPALWKDFVKLLSPFAPHLAEELWQQLGFKASVCFAAWPMYDPNLITEDSITLGVQINGKVRAELTVPLDTPADELIKQALALSKIEELMAGKPLKKSIAVPNKIINFVVG
jgi:leucyl-tRNA synthetase